MESSAVFSRRRNDRRQQPVDSDRRATPPIDSALLALVVEDDVAEKVRLAAIVEKLGFKVSCASDGVEALGIAERFRPSLIISDWHMPRMTGLQLCQRLKYSADTDHIYIILVTGRNRTRDLVAGLSAGADDFVAKPYDAAELRARIGVGHRILQARAALKDSNDSLTRTLTVQRKKQRRVQDDLDEAARFQSRLLPPRSGMIGTFQVGHIFHPAENLAGDVFGCFSINERTVGFYHVDVVGHGTAAALISFSVARTLSTQSSMPGLLISEGNPRNPALVVNDLNRQFLGDDRCDQYFTMIYGVVDSRSGEGRLCQAGHPHPLKLNRRGEVEELGAGGFPVALLREAEYTDTDFTLEYGERLICYSDGVSEGRSDRGEMYGIERLAQTLAATRDLTLANSLAAVERSVESWHGDRSWEDDVSLLAIARS